MSVIKSQKDCDLKKPEHIMKIASMLASMGEPKKAEKALKWAVKNISEAGLYEQLADYQSNSQDYKTAILNYDKCLSLTEDSQARGRLTIKKAELLASL
jgi:hypothetical protein